MKSFLSLFKEKEKKEAPTRKNKIQILERKCESQIASLPEILELYATYTSMGKTFPIEWEELSLKLALEENPERIDLFMRLREVLHLQGKETEARELANKRYGVADQSQHYGVEAAQRLYQKWLGYSVHMRETGERWGYYSTRLAQELFSCATYQEFLHFAQSGIGFEHRRHISHDQHLFRVYERDLVRRFPEEEEFIKRAADIEASVSGTTAEMDDREVSAILFYLLNIMLSASEGLQSPLRILEIGAGYGALCRLWHTHPTRTPKQYTIVDLPECLAASYIFLREQFGKDAIFTVDTPELSDDATARMARAKVVLCPASLCDVLVNAEYDLCLNTGSLQEMTDDWVTFYMGWLDRMNIGRFYSLNYFGNPMSNRHEGVSLWCCRPTGTWRAMQLTAAPMFMTLQTSDAPRNFAEAIYEKKQPIASNALNGCIEYLLSRTLNLQTVLELLDCARHDISVDSRIKIFKSIANSQLFNISEALYFGENHILKNTEKTVIDSETIKHIENLRRLREMNNRTQI